MNNKQRVKKLETKNGAGKKKNYICVIGLDTWNSPEEQTKGYTVQPCAVEFGGTGEKPFYIATQKELEEFAARSDVNLDIIKFEYVDNPPA